MIRPSVLSVCLLLVAGVALVSPARLQDRAQGVVEGSRGSHRLKLVLPLLIRISLRLAALVPMAGMGLLLLLALVAFAKKALLVSLATLGIVVFDKLKRAAPIHDRTPQAHKQKTTAAQHEYVRIRPVFKKEVHHWPQRVHHGEQDFRNDVILQDSDDDFEGW